MDNLNQNFRYPSETRLGEILLREYGRESDFVIVINGTELSATVLPGASSRYQATLPSAGPVELTLTICERPMTKSLAGIAVRVGGKIIGTPSTFGLEDDPEVPAKLLPRIYGDVAAEEMEPYVTADGSIFVDGSNAYRELSEWIVSVVKQKLESVCQAELQLARARIRKDILRRLESLPEHRRAAATRHIERVLRRLYGEAQDRIDAVIALGLDAMEKDEYWVIFQHLNSIDSSNAGLLTPVLASVDPACSADPVVIEDLHGRTLSG